MVTDGNARRTRRGVLASAAAGAAALAASRIAEPPPAHAANGGNMILGQSNNATATTSLDSSTAIGLSVFSSGDVSILATNTKTPGDAVSAKSNGIAVHGTEGSGQFDPFLNGPGSTHIGVYGYTGNQNGYGVYGQTAINGGTYGVFGSGDGGGLMYGSVVGLSSWGWAAGGCGVHGHVSESGVLPAVAVNTALYGTVDNRATKYGLQVQGRVRLVDRSGRVTITAGHATVVKSIAGVSSTNIAVATLNANRTGNQVRAVVCSAGKITIYLTKAVTSSTAISWIVLG